MVKELLDGLHLLIFILILARALCSFLPPHASRHPLVGFINTTTEPILAPFRNILPQNRQIGIDFSPLFALLVVDILHRLLTVFLLTP